MQKSANGPGSIFNRQGGSVFNQRQQGEDSIPVFVGFNAPFDWSFVNYYFHRYLGENPFGFAALDIKSMYMGATGCKWTDTRSSRIAEALNPKREGDHDALHDALYQAELFRLTRKLM
ncbi:hypothetical protein KW839_26400 [Pseudomonas sp. PDM31]|nr:hypothetical protein [Pseudomonas sp. PDM31]